MLYKAEITDSERLELAGLIGQPLEAIYADVWCAELHVPNRIIFLTPEEVATPDDDHRSGDVDRPKIEVVTASNFPEAKHLLAEKLGLILEVNVLSILTSFSPCKPFEERLTFPSGKFWDPPKGRSVSYGHIYFEHSLWQKVISDIGPLGAVVNWDIAFELVTEKCPSIVVYTRGYFICVSLEGLPQKEAWGSPEFLVRQRLS